MTDQDHLFRAQHPSTHSDPVTPKRDQIVQWNCSWRCWQEGGPHDEGCKPTRYYHEADFDSLAAQLEQAQKGERQLREALEGVEVFYPEALTLIRELVRDAQKVYEPEKGWPPHIEQALNMGDHDETLAQVRAALAAYDARALPSSQTQGHTEAS